MKKYVVIYQSDLNFGLFANKVFDTLEDAQRCIRIELCKLILEEEKAFQRSNTSMFNKEDTINDTLFSILNGENVFFDNFSCDTYTASICTRGKNDVAFSIESIMKED